MCLLLLTALRAAGVMAQASGEHCGPHVFFPETPSQSDPFMWSIGAVTYTTHEDLTEETRIRVPAIDLHAIHRVVGGLYVDARVLGQLVQNRYSAGLRWGAPISQRFQAGIGMDIAFWHGDLPVSGFDTRGRGWTAQPGLSIGLRCADDVLITLSAELRALLRSSYEVGERTTRYLSPRVNGGSYSIFLEQPFFKRTRAVLGFSATVVDQHWVTWALFERPAKPLFYPEITIALIP